MNNHVATDMFEPATAEPGIVRGALGEHVADADDEAAGRRQCDNCNEWFTPRKGSGGKPQRFCSQACRQDHHTQSDPNVPNVPNVAQRGATLPTLPAVRERKDSESASATSKTENRKFTVLQPVDRVDIEIGTDGSLTISQECWPDDDQSIFIPREHVDQFIDRLTDALGYGGAP